MLILDRLVGESIIIDNSILVTIIKAQHRKVLIEIGLSSNVALQQFDSINNFSLFLHEGELLLINKNIEILIMKIRQSRKSRKTTIAITAPKDTDVHRLEYYEKLQEGKSKK